MNTIDTTTIARQHLDNAIFRARSVHMKEIDKACHIYPQKPESIAQFIEWMENKKYKINNDVDINEPLNYGFSEIFDNLEFRTEEPDHIKRKASYKKVEEDYEELKLRVNVLDPSTEKMIEDVKKFQKKTYH